MGKRTHGPHLIHAIETNDHGKVHEILAVQVRSKTKIRELCLADVKRLASDHTDCPLMVAASIPDPSIIKYLITKHNVDANFTHSQGAGKRAKTNTPLLNAVRRGLYPTVDVLLTLNVDANFQDHKGRSALHHAVKKANFKMAKMLLSHGAKVNVNDNGNNTPLHIATKYGHVELAKLLLQYGADAYKRGHFGGLPIHIAAREGHIALVQLFCAHEVSINTKVPCYTDMREKSPLHVAAEEGHKEMVLALVEEFGAEVSIPDSEGETPIHCCVLNEYDPHSMRSKDDFVDSAKILIQCGADVNLRNGRGETPLHLAARNEYQKVVELLIVAGADPLVEDNDKNKPVDLVSDDDTVSKQALKRAVTDREKYVSQLLESRARGLSGSMASMPSRMMGSMTSLNYGGQPLNMNRAMSNPMLFGGPLTQEQIYQDGYLQALGSRDRLASIGSMGDPLNPFDRMARAGSMRSLQHDMLAFDRMQRPGSMRALHSTGWRGPGSVTSSNTYASMEDPYGQIDTSDVASLMSEGTVISDVNGFRQVKRKTSAELNRLAANRQADISSDSSQYDENPIGSEHTNNPQYSALHQFSHITSTPSKNTPMYLSAGQAQHDAIYQSHKQLQALAKLAEEGQTEPSLPVSESNTPQTSFSTFHDRTLSHDDSWSVAEDEHATPRAPLAQSETATEDEDDAIYQNMPGDEPATSENNTPVAPPQPIQPAVKPPMLKPRPAQRPSTGSQVQQRQQQIAHQFRKIQEQKRASSGLPIHVDVVPLPHQASTPTTPLNDTSQQSAPNKTPKPDPQITINISRKQTLTISPSKDTNTSSSSMNQEWRQLPSNMMNQNAEDSDDTFFDDASFDTLSDSTEALDREGQYSSSTSVPVESASVNKVEDPKFKTWIAEQAAFIVERQSSHEEAPATEAPQPLSGVNASDENSNIVKNKPKPATKKKKKSKDPNQKKPSLKPKPSPKPQASPKPQLSSGLSVLPVNTPQPALRKTSVNSTTVPMALNGPASPGRSSVSGSGEDIGSYWEHEDSGTLRLKQAEKNKKTECEYVHMGSPTADKDNQNVSLEQYQSHVMVENTPQPTKLSDLVDIDQDKSSNSPEVDPNGRQMPDGADVNSAVMSEYHMYKNSTEVTAASPEGIQQKVARRFSESELLDASKPPISPSRFSSGSGSSPRTSHSLNMDTPGYASMQGSQSSLQQMHAQELPSIQQLCDTNQMPEGVYEELPAPKRKVTIGADVIIPRQRRSSRESEQRTITYDSNGKVRIAVIGGNSEGIFIHRIDPGSDADRQGLLEGDQIMAIHGKSTVGKTKEDAVLSLMNLNQIVELTVRYKRERYERVAQNGGMGDSFFVKALFSYSPLQSAELKIKEGDVFSIRDTLPDGRMGSWRALKINARTNEAQNGLIPNQARAEQVALATKKKQESNSLEKERGGFLRRSLRRAKSADRLNKETEAMNRNVAPVAGGDIKAYEWVEQKPPGFIRPVILIGLFADTVRDRLMAEQPGMFELAPPEVEIPGSREEGNTIKIPVNTDIIEATISRNRHCLMIVSPKAIQFLHTTSLFPIVIYLNPGSKSIVKHLRTKFAPGFERKSSFMYDEAVQFEKQHNKLFTATVTYTTDDSWFSLLKDTISRIQKQPLWQPCVKSKVLEDNYDSDMSIDASPVHRLNNSARPIINPAQVGIPDPIRNMIQRHSGDSSLDEVFTADDGIPRPPNTTLTYDGYFLSPNQGLPPKGPHAPHNMSTGGIPTPKGPNTSHNRSVDIGAYMINACSVDAGGSAMKPKSILKKRGSQSSVDSFLMSPPSPPGGRQPRPRSGSMSNVSSVSVQNGFHPGMMSQVTGSADSGPQGPYAVGNVLPQGTYPPSHTHPQGPYAMGNVHAGNMPPRVPYTAGNVTPQGPPQPHGAGGTFSSQPPQPIYSTHPQRLYAVGNMQAAPGMKPQGAFRPPHQGHTGNTPGPQPRPRGPPPLTPRGPHPTHQRPPMAARPQRLQSNPQSMETDL